MILHPRPAARAPEVDPELGTKDAAMFTQLVVSLPTINQSIDDNLARSRNQPPPAPPDPNSRKFWRVKCDWSVDSDQDGSPDWAEFEIASRINANQGAVQADAFDPDTDHNGVPDGDQLDYDADGVADNKDADLSDDSAAFEIGLLPRYALFPIVVPKHPGEPTYRPVEVNDSGTVLCPYDAWTGGAWTSFAKSGEGFAHAKAFGINDLGEIVGTCERVQPSPEARGPLPGNMVYWNSPTRAPALIQQDGFHAWSPLIFTPESYFQGSMISNDGSILAYSESVSVAGLLEGREQTYLWTLPGSGRTPAKESVTNGYEQLRDRNHYWGVISAGETPYWSLHSDGASIPLQEGLNHFSFLGDSSYFLSYSDGTKDSGAIRNQILIAAPAYSKAIDVSEDGTAIANSHGGLAAPIYLNGKWTDIFRAIPDAPGFWSDQTVRLLDTTARGWVLAERGDFSHIGSDYGVMLPLRAECLYVKELTPGETTTKNTGVDDFSAGSSDPGPAVQNKIWIMAPLGGEAKSIIFKTPLDGIHPLVLSAPGIDFGNVGGKGYLYGNSSTVSALASIPAETGQELPINLEFGPSTSISKPVAMKVMRRRTLHVTVYYVTKVTPGKPDNPPDLIPEQSSLQAFLNDIYKPQLNLNVQVKVVATPLVVDWDLESRDRSLAIDPVFDVNSPNFAEIDTPEQGLIVAERSKLPKDEANIEVYILGSERLLGGDAWGSTNRDQRRCWIMGDDPDKDPYKTLTGDPLPAGETESRNEDYSYPLQYWNIAHEIGHVLVGYGHPNEQGGSSGNRGKAPLPGTDHRKRLMLSGKGRVAGQLGGFLLVKGEWDEAEKWIRKEEISERIKP